MLRAGHCSSPASASFCRSVADAGAPSAGEVAAEEEVVGGQDMYQPQRRRSGQRRSRQQSRSIPHDERRHAQAEFVDQAGGGELGDEARSALAQHDPHPPVVQVGHHGGDFGRAVGITLFQGRQVENLIAEEGRKRELRRLKQRIQRS